MSRKSFDDGHQNRGHAAGFDLTFQVMHDLFHPPGSRDLQVGFVDGVARVLKENSETGIYEPSDKTSITRADVEAQAAFEQRHEMNDLGDLVDPQNDTYEEEGTHGLPLLAKAAATGYMKARSNPKTAPLIKAGEQAVIEKGKEVAGKALGVAKDKLKGKGGAGLASPDSEGVGTPDSDDPFA